MTTRSTFLRRATRALVITLTAYALLVATHRGEFWPFSIFPMFSQAGHPWTRAVVRQVPHQEPAEYLWRPAVLDELLGRPFPVRQQGINENDVANFVSKTVTWDTERLRGLRKLLGASSSTDASLLVYRVTGRLHQTTVQTTATPLILFAPNATFTAPSIRTPPAQHP